MEQQIETTNFGGSQWKWLAEAGDLWCSLMHTAPMWPIHGRYDCGVCGRRYLVPWGEDNFKWQTPGKAQSN
jgi:hypothetical protein